MLPTVALGLAALAEPGGTHELAAPREPLGIIGGQPAGECVFPTTVAVKTSGGLCTGTLVHPRVVVYAAHCGASSPTIGFGQHADVPAFEAAVDVCETNPDYLGASNQAQDWAYCRLAEPVTGVPITPPLYGCETDAIEPGASVVIAGFGQDGVGFGSGPKRWAQTEIVSTFGSTATIGGDGVSTCAGDSGGSAFVRLDDGAWRAISMVSAGADCASAVHALMHDAVPWIEQRSGIDITPCHDVDGSWNPTQDCTGFYAGEPDDEAAWDDACTALPRTTSAATCGPAVGDGTSDGSDTGDDDGTAGDDSGDATGEIADDGSAPEGGSESGPMADDDTRADDDAHGCRVGGDGPARGPTGAAWAVVALALGRRRAWRRARGR